MRGVHPVMLERRGESRKAAHKDTDVSKAALDKQHRVLQREQLPAKTVVFLRKFARAREEAQVSIFGRNVAECTNKGDETAAACHGQRPTVRCGIEMVAALDVF